MTFSRAMSLMAMGFIWVGSQIPLYLFGEFIFDFSYLFVAYGLPGAIPPYVSADNTIDRRA